MSAWFPRVTLHSLAIVISMLVYVLTTRVEHERRPPSIAIAWVLGMLALPYLALPMYIFFGRRKLPRKVLRVPTTRPHGKHWAEDLIESFGLAPSAPSAIHLHQDGGESAAALFATISSAALRLDICTYILGDDPFGRDVMQRMIARAGAGARVRLLIDGVGAIQLPRSCFRQLRSAGIETAIFSPLLARKTQGPRNLRNHRKMVIADGARLWAGGRNIAAEYFMGLNGARPWGDLTFDLQGQVAAAAAAQFEADWVAAGGSAAGDRDGAAAGLAAAGVTPYFVPDAALETALRLAARRGVQIDFCIPAVSNHRLYLACARRGGGRLPPHHSARAGAIPVSASFSVRHRVRIFAAQFHHLSLHGHRQSGGDLFVGADAGGDRAR